MARQKSNRRAAKKIKKRSKIVSLAYPLYLFLLLCAGVFLVAATLRTNAADILIRAKVNAPSVTEKAVITSPAANATLSSIPVTVTGTCPANAGYVEVMDDGVMRGVAICGPDADFELMVDLTAGRNTLTARVFNITDDEGPVSDSVTVFYAPGGNINPSAASSGSLPQLNTDFIYKGYHLGDNVIWPLKISGGKPPYTVDVDWGDNTSSRYNQNTVGLFNIAHTYQELPPNGKNFVIKVTAKDSLGAKAYLQFFVIVASAAAPGTSANIFTKPPPSLSNSNWLWYVWPAYLLILIMTLSYWLGEQEELIILKRKGLLIHHR